MKILIRITGSLFFCISLCVNSLELNHPSVVVSTASGGVVGERSTDGEVAVFRGIPYALPPIANLRWKPTEPFPAWQGHRSAKNFSPACMQPGPVDGTDTSLYSYRPAEQASEDCLYLNVWSPFEAIKSKGKSLLPVMVWIHGGGFTWGASSMRLYDGEALTRKGVIVVSFNYRLGMFGYFSHPELTAESVHHSSGNFGTLDQIAALRWVQKHISQFGGDPNNVTLFGESSGGTSVSQLMATQRADGLFHKAIIQSATLPPMPLLKQSKYGLPSAEASGVELQAMVGAKSIEDMRRIPAIRLLSISQKKPYIIDPGPVVDGWLFKQQVMDVFENLKQHKVPLLVGFTADEGSFYYLEAEGEFSASVPMSEPEYVSSIKQRYGKLSSDYLKIYPKNDLYGAVVNPIRDAIFGWAALYFARSNSQLEKNTYVYYFNHPPGWARETDWGAFHISDLIYSFNNVENNFKYSQNWPDLNPTKVDYEMGELMSDYWVTFAKNGNPNMEGRPQWERFIGIDSSYMAFSEGKGVAANGLLHEPFLLHEKIVRQRRSCGVQSWWFTNIGLLAPKDSMQCQGGKYFTGDGP